MVPVVPLAQAMSSAPLSTNLVDLLPGEQEIYACKGKRGGRDVDVLVTDRRLVLRDIAGFCNACWVCYKKETDECFPIADLKYVQSWIVTGCWPRCKGDPDGCGVNLGFAKHKGEYIPGWNFKNRNSNEVILLHLDKKDAVALRRILMTHPNATGLGYITPNTPAK
eukprot:jgi/Chrzof1/2506/Cz11g18050.t1